MSIPASIRLLGHAELTEATSKTFWPLSRGFMRLFIHRHRSLSKRRVQCHQRWDSYVLAPMPPSKNPNFQNPFSYKSAQFINDFGLIRFFLLLPPCLASVVVICSSGGYNVCSPKYRDPLPSLKIWHVCNSFTPLRFRRFATLPESDATLKLCDLNNTNRVKSLVFEHWF